jgi:hypothetical protein
MPRIPKKDFAKFYNGLSFDDTYTILGSWGAIPYAYLRGRKITYGEADFEDLPKRLQFQLRGEAKEIMMTYKPIRSRGK